MQTIVARHKVKDIDAWLKGHQERMELFAPAVSGFKTFQDAGDPNSVVLVIEVTDLELLGNIINDPVNQAIKDKHTVLDPIILAMPVDL
ncbi:MAG: hypothetical protein ABI472_10165 [Ginsengibacter sp.]